MGKWTELARQLSGPPSGGDISDNSAISPPKAAQSAPNVTNVTNVTVGIPEEIAAGLAALQAMPAPRITRPEVWPQIVGDALRLASSGLAVEALSLGWHPLHLWGCSPLPGGDELHEGLAVRLSGRKAHVFPTHAIMESAAATHSVFTLRPMDGAAYLWELGKCSLEGDIQRRPQ